MPVQGLVRLRKHQFGRQSVFGTAVAATRAYPFKGVPDVNLNWTDPDIDAGSLDIVAPPYREAPDFTASLTDPSVKYNDLPLRLDAFFGGANSPTTSGTAESWAFAPASATIDDWPQYTYEMGDDVLTDWFQMRDGFLESWEVTAAEGLGVFTDSQTWRFGNAASTGSTDFPVTGTVPTPDLSVSTDDAIVYGKDTGIYIASSVAGLAAGQVTDALHSFTLRFSGDIDQKRYMNADQSFAADAFARATRLIELECSWAKTDDIVGTGSETDAWFSDTATNRYIRIVSTSTVEADTGVPYSWTTTMPMRYYTRADQDSGGNAIVVLTARAFYDPVTPAGVFASTVVNTLSDAELGTIAS